MSRKKREWYPGAIYHVMSRGNRRGALYKDDNDYIAFLMHVDRVRERYPFKVHACCLMTNHFHMLIETMEEALYKIMQKILHSYIRISSGNTPGNLSVSPEKPAYRCPVGYTIRNRRRQT